MKKAIRLSLVLLMFAVAFPSAQPAEARTTLRRVETTIKFQIPITVAASHAGFFEGEGTGIEEYFDREAENFWNDRLKELRYKVCYQIEIDIEVSERTVPEPDFAMTVGGHTVYYHYSNEATDSYFANRVASGADPFTANVAAVWNTGRPHSYIGFFVGLEEWVEVIDQALVDKLGKIYENRPGNKLPDCIKATQKTRSSTEGHPTAGGTFDHTLEVQAAVEEDGSLTGDATFTIAGTWWTLGDPLCEYVVTAEGIDLAVSGAVEGNTVSIAVEGDVVNHYEGACPFPDMTYSYSEFYGAAVPLVGELVDGRYEDEQTIQWDQWSKSVVETVIEIEVDEESVG